MSLRLSGPRDTQEFIKGRRISKSDRGPKSGEDKRRKTLPDLTKDLKPENAASPNDTCNDFGDLMELVGSEGKLQNQLLYGFCFPLVAIMPFFVLNLIFMLYEPDHWCYVPGKDPEMDESTWKNLTIPREAGSNDFSKCLMFAPDGNGSKIECLSGWNYDRSDYRETLPSAFNWVCGRGHFATAVFTAAAVGSCVGTPILGWAGDKIGRKIVFFITMAMSTLFRGIALFVPQYFEVFLFTQFMAGTAFPMMYIVPFTILAEISSNNFRSWIYASTWMIWVVGICLLPLVAWLCADWFLIGVVTWTPGLLLFLYYKMLPESPRWLASVGRLNEASTILKRIAEVNGTSAKFKDGQIDEILNDLHAKQLKEEIKTPQIWDLFSRRRLAFYTILLGLVWSINGLIYYGITLNTTNMSGNQFLNFFYLSLIELPAGWLGRILVEKVGRRWSQVVFFVLCSVGFCLAAVGSSREEAILVIAAVIISKFSVAITSLVVNLQANEIFPTQLRATGNGFVGTVSALVGIAGPTIIYLRKFHESAPYIAMGLISIIGFISSALIPETLNQSLPETVEDSNNLGKRTKFWSFLPKDYKSSNKSQLPDCLPGKNQP